MTSRSRPLPSHPGGPRKPPLNTSKLASDGSEESPLPVSSTSSSPQAAFLQPHPPSPTVFSRPVSPFSIASAGDVVRSTTSSPTPSVARKIITLPTPPPLTFDIPSVSWSGLPLADAQYTLSSQQLQDIVSRAIRAAAEESSIRLLPPDLLNTDLPAELARLDSLRLTTQAQYRFLTHRRTMLLQSLNALSFASASASSDALSALTRQVADVTLELDKLALQLLTVAEHRAQITKLLDVHAMSALGMALRKLNTSFAKRSTELSQMHARVKELEESLRAKEEAMMGEIEVGIEPGHRRMDSDQSSIVSVAVESGFKRSNSDEPAKEPAKEQPVKRSLSVKTQLPPVLEEDTPLETQPPSTQEEVPLPRVESTELDQPSRVPPRESVIPADASLDHDDERCPSPSLSHSSSPPLSPIEPDDDDDAQVIMINITGRAVATPATLTTSPPASDSVHSRSSSKSSLQSRLATATPDQAQSRTEVHVQDENMLASPTIVEPSGSGSGSASPVPIKNIREIAHVPPLQIQKLRGKQQAQEKGTEKRKRRRPLSALRVPSTGIAGYLASPRELIGLAFLTDPATPNPVDASRSDNDDDESAEAGADEDPGDMSIDVAEALMGGHSPRGGYQTLDVSLPHQDGFVGTPALATGMSSHGSGRPHSLISVEDVLSAAEGTYIYMYFLLTLETDCVIPSGCRGYLFLLLLRSAPILSEIISIVESPLTRYRTTIFRLRSYLTTKRCPKRTSV